MYEVLKFDWDDDDEIKEIVKRWAYNDGLFLMDQDEEDLFENSFRWTELAFNYVFDESCVKREYIVRNLSRFIRHIFLWRKQYEIEQTEFLFIKNIRTYLSLKQDKLLEECADYFHACKAIYDHPAQVDFEQTKVIGKLLLNGLTNNSKINEPIIAPSGNYEITSTSSVTCHLCIDKENGIYKYNLYTPCE